MNTVHMTTEECLRFSVILCSTQYITLKNKVVEYSWRLCYFGWEISDRGKGNFIAKPRKPWIKEKSGWGIDCKTSKWTTTEASSVALLVFHGLLTTGLAWWIDQERCEQVQSQSCKRVWFECSACTQRCDGGKGNHSRSQVTYWKRNNDWSND